MSELKVFLFTLLISRQQVLVTEKIEDVGVKDKKERRGLLKQVVLFSWSHH